MHDGLNATPLALNLKEARASALAEDTSIIL